MRGKTRLSCTGNVRLPKALYMPAVVAMRCNPLLKAVSERLLGRGFEVVVFGHTHLAKEIRLGSGTYINTGTWADLLPFPTTILDPDNGADSGSADESDASKLDRLGKFVKDMATAQLGNYLRFMPTYAQIELDDKGGVVTAKLCDYGGEGDV